MANITKDHMNDVIDTFTLSKTCTVSLDKDTNGKTVHLRIKFEGATINTLAQSCLGQGSVVKWQNGRGRKIWNELKDNQVVNIEWARPASAPEVDGKTKIIMEAQADGVNIHDKAALTAYINKRFGI